MTSFMLKLGIKPPVQFTDVYGLDDELLGMIPGKCLSFILLFPITNKVKFRF